jgi:NitT/TauT family transport system permease protein
MDSLLNEHHLVEEVAPPGALIAWRRLYQRHRSVILGSVTMAFFLVIWELAPALGLVKPIFTSSPSRIVVAAQWLFANGFWYDIWVSFSEFALGFGLAIALGIPVGVLLGWFPTPRAMFEPFVISLYSVPRVALLPLIILWLGIGIQSKVAMVFLGAIFPIIVNAMSGVTTVDEVLVKCARAFGANDRQVLWTVALPGSVPFMIAGMRLGAGRGLVGVVVGEMVAAQAGVGHMMARAGATFQTDKVFVGVILLAIFGLLLSKSLQALEAKVDSWRVQH